MNPVDMNPRDFAKWCRDQICVDLPAAIEARDRRILQQAASRVQCYCTHVERARAAILGEPPFVKGQLVRHKVQGVMFPLSENLLRPDQYEPVRAHIDEAGRVIIDEEAPA